MSTAARRGIRANITLSIPRDAQMKTLSPNDRPREKLLRLGAAGLGDNELMAIVVGSGSHRTNALALASQILETAGGLHGIPRISVDDLRRLDGIGVAKAAQVLAAVELGRRTLLRCPPLRVKFNHPREVAGYLLPQFGARPVEQFGLVMLDTKYRLLRTSVISVGTLDSSPELELQKQAVRAIGRRPKDEAIPILIRTARNHPSVEVRKIAVQMLGQTGDERAISFFRELLAK